MAQTRKLAGPAPAGKPAANIAQSKPIPPRTASKEELAQRYLAWLIFERRILAQEIDAVSPDGGIYTMCDMVVNNFLLAVGFPAAHAEAGDPGSSCS